MKKTNPMKTQILFLLLIVLSAKLLAQSENKGYIIEIDGTSVITDYTSGEVKVGDRLQVVSEPKVMVHPVTKQEIIKEGELIATLEITEIHGEYSIAGKVSPANAIAKLKVGDKVALPGERVSEELPKDGKVTVAIADAAVNDVVGTGYFGNYVADLLMQEMLGCDKIRLIDRSMLNAQIDETNLAESGYINQSNAILKGQIAGVQYMIQVTMQRPDVTNLTTGLPVKSLLTAAGAITNAVGASKNLSNSLEASAALSSNVQTAKLKAAVSLTARVVDVQTGEVLFMCSGTGTSQGESQWALEGGALGGLQVNGGVEGFKQTVTGKAVALAYRKIGTSLKTYFNGETTEKVIKSGLLDTEMTWRKGQVFMGVNKLSKNEIREAFSNNPQLYFDFKKRRTQNLIGNIMMGIGGAGCCFFVLDFIIGNEITYNSNSSILLTCASATIGVSGFFLHKSGSQKIRQSINTYNQSLHKTSYKPEFNIGLSPGGLAMRVTF